MRKDGQLKKLLDYIDGLDLETEINKYNVDKYTKTFHVKDLMKLNILFLFSREPFFKNFLVALKENPFIYKHFGIQQVSVQQVFKSLQHKCWWFFYEAFHILSKQCRNKNSFSHRLFKDREIKIADSTFLEYCIERLFFAKFGYAAADKAYKQGIKLHVLYDYSKDAIEKCIETSANTHDSKVADTLFSEIKDCILLIDKGYQKLKRFASLDAKNVTFIIPVRTKF